MRGVIGNFETSIGGLDKGMFIKSIKETFSFNARMLGNDIKINESVVYILAITVVSCVVMIIAYSKTYRRK